MAARPTPGAQVWISQNSGPEVQIPYGMLVDANVFKLPKAGPFEVRIPIELRGTVYKLSLKDGGKTLSTAVVVVP